MRLRCPKCQTVNEVPSKEEAVCSVCGFGAKQRQVDGPPGPPASVASDPASGSGRPMPRQRAPPARVWPPGISGTGAAVASFFSLGIYFLVLLWKWAAWRDSWDLRGRAVPWARWGIWLSAASLVLIVTAYVLFFAFMIGSFADASDAEPPPSFFVAFIAMWFGLMLGFGGLLAGRICLFVAQWRVWTSLQDALTAQGKAPRVTPIALLLIEIFGPQVMYFFAVVLFMVGVLGTAGVSSAVPGAPLLMIPLTLISIVLVALPILYVIRETQQRVLEVAGQAPGPPGAARSVTV